MEEFTSNIPDSVDFKADENSKKKLASLPSNKDMIHFITIKGSGDQDELILLAVPNSIKVQQEKKLNKKLFCLIICLLLLFLLVFVSIGVALFLIEMKAKPNASKSLLLPNFFFFVYTAKLNSIY